MKKWEKFSKEELQNFCNESFSYRELARKIGYSPDGGGTIQILHKMVEELSLNTDHFKGQAINKGKTFNGICQRKWEDKDIFIEHSPVVRKVIKYRILKDNLLEYKCAWCGNIGEWNNKKLNLQLDHINGISDDHRLINLRWLCPNCHSQTETFCSKNK